MTTRTLSSLLLPQASGNRHGLVLRPQRAYVSKSDVKTVVHIGVPSSLKDGWKSASGGVSFNEEQATLAAIGESVERYCAGIIDIKQKKRSEIDDAQRIDADDFSLYSKYQQSAENFPYANTYSEICKYSSVYNLSTNEEKWVPHPLIVLRDEYDTGIPTSSGLAAGATVNDALLRAAEELIERDALMTTWMHSLPGRSIEIPKELASQANELLGEVYAFDLTPSYSPFPVIAVAGEIPQRGKWRYSLGVACRETLKDAINKAFLEWCQGVFFAGVYPKFVDTSEVKYPNMVKTFDEHAIFYTQNPEKWGSLPLLKDKENIVDPSTRGEDLAPKEALTKIATTLKQSNIDLYYRDLTTIDALQSGVRVVRVLSQQLVPIHSHHNWPFLGGTAPNVEMRYPDLAAKSVFPNPNPHPLG